MVPSYAYDSIANNSVNSMPYISRFDYDKEILILLYHCIIVEISRFEIGDLTGGRTPKTHSTPKPLILKNALLEHDR